MNDRESLDEIIEYLDVKILAGYREAEYVIESYLKKWTPERKLKLHKKRPDQSYDDAQVGRLIPRVRMNTGKAYIEWTDQNSPKIKRINKKFTATVTPHVKKGYTTEILTKHCHGWEVDIVLEFETKLKPIRKAMNALHEAKIKLKSINRLYHTE